MAFFSDTEIEKKIFCSKLSSSQRTRKDGRRRISAQVVGTHRKTNSVERTQRSSKDRAKNSRQPKAEKNLDGLYEVLAPGSTVGKVSPTTSIIKEPNRPDGRVGIYNNAIFGTRNERDT